ncbi:MAG: DMT family transporter [Coriobacteriales bacterium]|jgi:drug/metabolite transporter (DMT)-like permease|nr:DMT family transporter [Coriobacteriales bacterium]
MNGSPSPQAVQAMRTLNSKFFRKGVILAVSSGMIYGVFSAFITQGMAVGPWAEWYGENSILSTFVIIYVLGMLGSGINDLVSSLWATGIAGVRGKFMDFLRVFRTKPGLVMIVCALIGGPISNSAYIIALQLAGPIAATITALCPSIGAIISRILFKQKLNLRMACGILICLTATFMIGSLAFTDVDISPNFMLGMVFALVAAFGWGFEGAVGGYGTTLIDFQISVSIRQTVSGFVTIFIAVPILCIAAGSIGLWPTLVGGALTSPTAMVFFLVSGFCSAITFAFWYKGTSMIGAALSMACNGAFSFWVPFFCWLILGVIFGQDGFNLLPIQWAAAIIMVFGIFLIAINPLDWFRKKAKEA